MEKTMDYDLEFGGTADWARFYRTLGWQVVPSVSPRSNKQWKRPLVEWRPLQHELVPDLTFARWYGENGDYLNEQNIGIITGQASKIVVIDLDVQKHPEAQLWWLQMRDKQKTAQEITTVWQKTGGGGFQHLFRIPDGWTAPTCKTSIGVDIRGQGGFAVIAPSLHESGKHYEWGTNAGPHEIEMAVMPEWLCEEIDALAAQYGAGTGSNTPATKTATPVHSVSDFGQIVDGREDYMTKFVWGWIVNLRREAPMINDAFMNTQCNEAFQSYQTLVKSRLPYDGTNTNADLLEMEGRGITAFRQKWQYAVKQWEDKVADHARQDPPKKKDDNRPFDPTAIRFDPETGEIIGEYPNHDLSIDDEFSPPKESADSFRLIPASQLVDEPVKWLIKDLLPALSLSSLYGKPGTYKTFVALYMASHIALGLRVFGRDTEQGDVVYIAGEGGAGLKKRYDALRKRHNLPDVHNLYFLKRQLNLRSKMDDLARLIKEIKSNNIKPKLIVIDTLARAFSGGNENSSEDMGAFIAMVGLLQQATGSAVLLVHHSGKDEARGQRGHSSLLGAVDAELELMKLSDDDSVHRIGQLTTTKQKDGEDGIKFLFHMESVALSDIDPDNNSLALVPVDDAKLPAKKKQQRALNQNDRSVLAALKAALNDAGEVVGLPQIPTGMRVVNVALWRQFYYTSSPNEPETKKKTFSRAIDRLVSSGTVLSHANYCWISDD
jgi:AAA domain/Bifunctional DNA primase/polymerase, N-terminal